MATLSSLYQRFLTRSAIFVSRAKKIQDASPKLQDWELRYLTESVISDLWQFWCGFCRSVILYSCNGTVSRTGSVIASRTTDNSWQRIGYEASCAAQKRPIKPSRLLQYRRQEPTWGDQGKIIDIISGTGPSNAVVLITAFGLPVQGLQHLQIVRNACAHKNNETIDDVRKLLLSYVSSGISSPADLAWEIDISKKICGIYSWIEDLRLVADEATKNA